MADSKIKNFEKYLFWAFLIVLAFISYQIIKNFVVAIVSSFVLAFLLLPLHKKLSKKISKKAAAILSLALILTLLILLSSFIATTLLSQISSLQSEKAIGNIVNSSTKILSSPKYLPSLSSLMPSLKKIANSVLNTLYDGLTYIPHFLLTIILTFFITYYLLVDWERIKNQIIKIIPLKNKKELIERISKSSKKIVYGALITALVTFIISLFGFYLIGIKYYAFFAFLTSILTFIPIVGPFLVWLPLLLIELIRGNFIAALALLILGLTLSVLIDDFVRMWIIGKEAKLHPVIVLLGILGGIPLFGLAGFIIGPLILSIFIEIIKTSMGTQTNKE